MSHLTRFVLCIFAWLVLTFAADAQDRVKIGVISHLSGPLADPQLMMGAKAAEADLRAGNGPIIEVVAVDAQSNPAAAQGQASKLVDVENVQVLIGSASIAPILIDISRSKGIPVFVLGLLSDEVAARAKDSRFFFHLGGTVAEFARIANDFATKNAIGGNTRFLLTPSQESGRFERAVQDTAAKQLDFKQSLPNSPSTIFSFSQSAETVANSEIPGGSLVIGSENLKAQPGQLRRLTEKKIKVFAIGLRDPSLEDRAAIPASLNKLEGPLGYYAYSAMQIIRSAMRGNNQPLDRVTNNMRSETFKTVIGDIKFLSSGACAQPQLVIYEMTKEKFSYCPTCTEVGGACSGGGCKCTDGSCRSDCCKKS